MRRLLGLAIAFGMVLVSAVVGPIVAPFVATAATGTPTTLPALRSWTAGSTNFTFTSTTRVVAAEQTLKATADTLAADLKSLTGVAVPAVVGAAGNGDIELRKGTVTGGTEAYRLTVGAKLAVLGNTDDGVFLGTRTILQLVKQNRTVPGGTATDSPLYPERGLMLDVGRQYMSISFLKARIRELSYLKLNQLHLHLSERTGFRLESTKHPEVTSPQHYTKVQIKDLIAYAAKYHVQVVPEIDMPGHMDTILASHPELKLVSGAGVVSHGSIDLSKPAAYTLMKDLITEYIGLFPGKYWHIGGDEYAANYADYPQLEAYAKATYGPNATAKDAFYGYLNWANAIVRGKGKTARMFNDEYKPGGSTLTVDPSIHVQHWSADGPGGVPWFGDAYTAPQLVAKGHKVMNLAHRPLTYTVAGPGSFDNSHPLEMYDTWDPSRFVDGAVVSDPTKNLGAIFQLWCDESTATEADLAGFLRERLRVLAQHSWRTPTPPFYALFIPVMDKVGDAPA